MFDAEAGGYNWLVFTEDGSLYVGHGPGPRWLHQGKFSVANGILTFLDGWDNVCPDNPEQTGTYQVRLLQVNRNDSFYLETIEETCLGRDDVFGSFRWDRTDMPKLP
jgi:hypothetical protein